MRQMQRKYRQSQRAETVASCEVLLFTEYGLLVKMIY